MEGGIRTRIRQSDSVLCSPYPHRGGMGLLPS